MCLFLIAIFQVEGQDLMLGTFGIIQDVTRYDDDVNLLVEFLLLVVENVVEFRNGAKGYRVRMKGQNGNHADYTSLTLGYKF